MEGNHVAPTPGDGNRLTRAWLLVRAYANVGHEKEKEKIRSVGVVHDQREEVLKAQFSCRTSRRAPDLGVQALPAPASHQRIELKSRKSGQVFAGSFTGSEHSEPRHQK